MQQKITIYQKGSVIGFEDCIVRDTYSCQLVCTSVKGSLFELSREHFDMLKNNKQSWTTAMEDTIRKLNWSYGDFIKEFSQLEHESKDNP